MTAILLCAPAARAQGFTHRDMVLAATGRPVAGATVTVCTSAGTGTPCTPLATIYTDETLGTAKSNPFTTDGRGNLDFSVPFGSTFVVTITGTQITAYSYRLTTTNPNALTSLNLVNQASAPATPGSENTAVYTKSSDNRLYWKDDGGAEHLVPSTTTTDTLTNKALTSPTLTTPRLAASSTFLDSAGTTSMGVTQKTGSGAGTYTTTSATYVDVDGTNLAHTVTVPVGWKAFISLFAWGNTLVNCSPCGYAITDGTTVLREYPVRTESFNQSLAGGHVFTGDGASHTFKIRFRGDGTDSVSVGNSSSTDAPVMIVDLKPSN